MRAESLFQKSRAVKLIIVALLFFLVGLVAFLYYGGQPENLLENVATGQNEASENAVEEEDLADRRTNTVNHIIEIVGKGFLEQSLTMASYHHLDRVIISAAANELDYYDWSNVYYNNVGVHELDGSNAGSLLRDYGNEFAKAFGVVSDLGIDVEDPEQWAAWRQFLLDNNVITS